MNETCILMHCQLIIQIDHYYYACFTDVETKAYRY